ncbi:MAG: hypothetical protein R8G66_26090 [Cytophagales bacterium]|nr:hypothetical protein [Cytophagales bacterium]
MRVLEPSNQNIKIYGRHDMSKLQYDFLEAERHLIMMKHLVRHAWQIAEEVEGKEFYYDEAYIRVIESLEDIMDRGKTFENFLELATMPGAFALSAKEDKTKDPEKVRKMKEKAIRELEDYNTRLFEERRPLSCFSW